MENIFNMAMVFGISLMLLLWIIARLLNHKLIDKISDHALFYIVLVGFSLFIVFLCFCMWSVSVVGDDADKEFTMLLIGLSLVFTVVIVYCGHLTIKQMKMEENKSYGTKAELEKLDRRIKAGEFIINHAGTIGIAAILIYFVFC